LLEALQAAREFAEKTVDQMRESYERSNRTFEAVVQAFKKSFDAALQGAAAQRLIIIDFAQKNLNLGFDLTKSLAGASSLLRSWNCTQSIGGSNSKRSPPKPRKSAARPFDHFEFVLWSPLKARGAGV
jgi:hypothetical protein